MHSMDLRIEFKKFKKAERIIFKQINILKGTNSDWYVHWKNLLLLGEDWHFQHDLITVTEAAKMTYKQSTIIITM